MAPLRKKTSVIVIVLLISLLGIALNDGAICSGRDSNLDTLALESPQTTVIQLTYVFGYKHLEDSWQPAQHQVEFGLVDFQWTKSNWPVSIAAQLLLTYCPVKPRLSGMMGDFSGSYEFNAGVRKMFLPESELRPFLSAGVGILGASTTSRIPDFGYVQEENRSAFGFWGQAGIFFDVVHTWIGGVSIQYSSASIALFNHGLDAGGLHVLFHIGTSWSK